MQYLGNGQYQIQNRQTGETKVVKAEELGQYGLSPAATMSGQQSAPASPPPGNGMSAMAGNVDPAIQKFQHAWNAAPDAKTKDQIAVAWKDAHGYDLFGQAPQTPEQKSAAAAALKKQEAQDKIDQTNQQGYLQAKESLQSVIDAFNLVPPDQKGATSPKAWASQVPGVGGMIAPEGKEYESGRLGVSTSLGKVLAGAGTGIRVSQSELNAWARLLPSIHKTDAQNSYDITRLDSILKSKFGKGLDKQYLPKNPPKNPSQPQQSPKQGGSLVDAATNALPTIGQIGGSIAGGVAGAAVPVADLTGVSEIGGAVAGGAAGGAWGQAAKNAIDKQKQSLPDIGKSAGIGALSGLMGEGAGQLGGVAVRGFGSLLGKGAVKTGEVVTGGGTKDFIAKNVHLDNAQAMSKVLMDKGILGKLTTKGRIEQTTRALTDTGMALSKVLQKSPVTITGSELVNMIETPLKQDYPAAAHPIIDDMLGQLRKNGIFELKSGDQKISMDQLDKLKQALYKYGLKTGKMPANGAIGKDIGQDAARIIRNHIAEVVPEATPYLREYGALRTYMDDILQDPQGMDIKGFDKIISSLASSVRVPVEKGLQTAYSAGKGMSSRELPSIPKRATQRVLPNIGANAMLGGNQ